MRVRHHARRALPARLTRLVFLLAAASLLATAIIGGLLRAGVALPVPGDSAWPGQAVLSHAFLMMCGFMGTVIAIERAVALKARLAFAAPAASALAGVLMLAGTAQLAARTAVLAAFAFIAVNGVVVSRQRAPHTALLLTGAGCWLVGNLLFALGASLAAVVPWWFSFLVLTIAAERLEMTRLMRRRSGTAAVLYACLALLLAGSAAFALSPVWGGRLYGLSLLGLAAWLITFDIARRTVASHGLSRYMAVCLLLGYAWLAVSGIAWIATSLGYAARDAALHALGLGFVFSMMLAHAPVILPALARVKLQFGPIFYLPLALLHASLAVRLFLGPIDFSLLSAGAAGNAVAIAVFAVTLAGSALAWRRRHPAPLEERHAATARH
jgi:hypothetical protein